MSEFPYPGLRPFGRAEADIFFGREDHIDQLLAKLGQTHFVAVFGPSGFGKSSLVHDYQIRIRRYHRHVRNPGLVLRHAEPDRDGALRAAT